MGTSNFLLENASEYFVISFADDIDGFESDMAHENISNMICELPEWGYFEHDKDLCEQGSNRNHSRRFLASKDIELSFAGIELNATLIAMSNAGYYLGANLDYLIFFNESEYLTINDAFDEAIDDALFNQYTNQGIISIHKTRFIDRSNELLKQSIMDLEAIYKQVSTHRLRSLGIFSNGERVFEARLQKSSI